MSHTPGDDQYKKWGQCDGDLRSATAVGTTSVVDVHWCRGAPHNQNAAPWNLGTVGGGQPGFADPLGAFGCHGSFRTDKLLSKSTSIFLDRKQQQNRCMFKSASTTPRSGERVGRTPNTSQAAATAKPTATAVTTVPGTSPGWRLRGGGGQAPIVSRPKKLESPAVVWHFRGCLVVRGKTCGALVTNFIPLVELS